MVLFAIFLVNCLASLSIASREMINPSRSISESDIRVLIDGDETTCLDINGQFVASFVLMGTFKNLGVEICCEGRVLSTAIEVRLMSNHFNVKLNLESSTYSTRLLNYYKCEAGVPATNSTLTIKVDLTNVMEHTEHLKICEVKFFAEKEPSESHNLLFPAVDQQPHFSGTLELERNTMELVTNTTHSTDEQSSNSTNVPKSNQQISRTILDEQSSNSTNVPKSNQQISRKTLMVIIVGSSVSVATTIVVAAIIGNCINLKLRKKSVRIKDNSLFFDTEGSIDLGFENRLTIEENQEKISVSREIEDETKLAPSSEGNGKNDKTLGESDSGQNDCSHTEENFKDCAIYGSGDNKIPDVSIMVENEIYTV